MSAISLLSECVNTHALALLNYTDNLASAMLDLIQVETVTVTPYSKALPENEKPKRASVTMDSDLTTRNSKLPPFRRAALHFLTMLIRADISVVVRGSEKSRALSILKYITLTDEDTIVRVMSREAADLLEDVDSIQKI